MPINRETLNQKLYNELRTTEAEVIPQDTEEDSVLPKDAELFRFHFIRDNVDYGEVVASIDGTRKLTLWYDERVANSPKHFRDGTISWEDLAEKLKLWGQSKQLSFEFQPSSEIDNLKADLLTRKQENSLTESYHALNKKTSMNDSIPTVKVRIQHNREMQEGEQRFRAVEKIFIENAQGERILVPTTKPGIAGIYGRHIAEGGKPNDERWNHITSLVEEYSKMAGFVRATRGHQFNESAQRLVTEGINHYLHLRESLGKLRGKKGYNSYFESWTPPLMEDEVTEDMSTMFMSSSLDPRIESVMPILNKLSKNITEETKLSEVHELEEWAESMITFENTSEEQEADYGDDYQAMVQRVGKKAKAQEKKNPVDIAKLAKKLKAAEKKIKGKEETDEGWKGTLAGSAVGGVAGEMVGPAVGTAIGGAVGGPVGAIAGGLAGGPIGSAIGGLAGGKIGDKLGGPDEDEEVDEQSMKTGDIVKATTKAATQGLGDAVAGGGAAKDLVNLLVQEDPLAKIKKLSGL